MSKKHPLAHILRAIADGVPVEFRHSDQHPWITYDPEEHYVVIDHTQDEEVWRIKPKPKVKKWRWVIEDKTTGDLLITRWHYRSEEELHLQRPAAKAIQKIDSTEIEVEV